MRTKHTEKSIQMILYNYLDGRTTNILTIPNFYYDPRYESDILSITKAGYVNEFEIKTSLNDFKNEFRKKKRKHKTLEWIITAYRNKMPKHWSIPNYFWFVAPEKLIRLNLIPRHAGFIEVKKDKTIRIIKRAPIIHRNKIKEHWHLKIARGMMFRYWNLRKLKWKTK